MNESPLTRRIRHAVHPLYKNLEISIHPLRYLFLEITSRCNLACLHCGSDCGRDSSTDELSTDQWIEFIDTLPRSFDLKKLILVVTGGEPLCHPELPRILSHIRNGGMRFGMVSNGYALDDKRMHMLLDHGLNSLTISLDGTMSSHNWLRGNKKSFDRAVRAIRLATKSSLRSFDVVTCANPRNIGELDEIEHLLRDCGVKRWRLFSIFPKGRAAANDELILTPAQIQQLLNWIAARRHALAGKEFNIDFCCEGYLPTDVDFKVRDMPYFCRAGINIGSVLCDGAISACPNISRQLVQGNILEDDFKMVWEQRFSNYRDRSWMQKGPCARCQEWKKCQGNSMHLYDEETGHTVLCHTSAVRNGRRFPGEDF